MADIDFIKINIDKIGYNQIILLNLKDKIVITDSIKKNINQEKIDELLRIIRLWKNKYISSNNIDSEKFNISIVSGNDEEKIIGVGTYPSNYVEFKKWVRDIYE